MNSETAKCSNCGNLNEVRVSSGHSKPENKGRKYFTCLGCKQFNWVEDGEGQHPSGLKIDYSKNPERKAPITRQNVEEKVDWDEVARGKIRSLLIEAHIEQAGLDHPSALEVEMINEWVEVAMTGKLTSQKTKVREELADIDEDYMNSLGES